MTFNKLINTKEGKIRYCLERVEKYIPVFLKCFKCQNYGHHKKSCRRCLTYGRFGQKEPNHMEEDCPNETKYSNCKKNHPTFLRICNIYKKDGGIMKVSYGRNITSLKARKIGDSNMNVTQKLSSVNSTTNNNNNQLDKYKALIEKLLQLGPNDWLNFQVQLKKLHSAEIYQTEPPAQIKEIKLMTPIPMPEKFKSLTETNTIEEKLHRSFSLNPSTH